MTELREPPVAGDEVSTWVGSLERQRRTFAWKCGGLSAAGLTAQFGASTMTLGGLLKHLALVEDHYFTHRLHGRPMPEAWADGDWEGDPDWEWTSAAADSPAALLALWEGAVARSRDALREALADGGLDRPLAVGATDGRAPSLRRMLADLVEEYARHTGHADLLRESVDGLVGDDPPDQR